MIIRFEEKVSTENAQLVCEWSREKESLVPSIVLERICQGSWTIGIRAERFLYSPFLQNELSSLPPHLIYVSPLYYFSHFLRIDKYD